MTSKGFYRDPLRLLLPALAVVTVVHFWMLPLKRSFWLDESLIYWTIGDGFSAILARAAVSLQSVAFCMLEWLVASLGSTSELALRTPSLAAAFATALIYYRMGAEILDRETGAIFAILFLASPSVANQVPNARPYLLAMFFQAAALLYFARWIRAGRTRHALLWALFSAAACHFHYLFAVTLAPAALFASFLMARGSVMKFRDLLASTGLFAVAMLPAAPQLRLLGAEAGLLAYAGRPPLTALIPVVAPIGVILAIAGMVLLERLSGEKPAWGLPKSTRQFAYLGVVLLLPPAALFFAWPGLFVDKYLLSTFAGVALLWGLILRGLEPASIRRPALVFILIVANFWNGGAFSDSNEDWRAAVRSAPDSGALVLYSGLVETRRLDWLQSGDRWGYLAAPLLAYRPNADQAGTFLLPYELNATAQQYAAAMLARLCAERDAITLIARGTVKGEQWTAWVSNALLANGFQQTRATAFEGVALREFRKRGQGRIRGAHPLPAAAGLW